MTPMAEPGPAPDETAAVDGGETVGVPNPLPTDAVELAWSGDDGGAIEPAIEPALDDEIHGDVEQEPAAAHQSWRATWSRAATIFVIGVGLGAIVLGVWALTRPGSATNAVEPAPGPSASATTSAPGAAPSSIASTPDQDSRYLQALNDQGISFANPEAAIYNGKTVCQNIGQGMTVQQVVAAFRASSPAFSDNADHFVAISVRAYCPQNSNLVVGF
jgi:hypothetical protein